MSTFKEGPKYKIPDLVELLMLVRQHTNGVPNIFSIAHELNIGVPDVAKRLAELDASTTSVGQSDLELLLLCYKHTPEKPNMHAVTRSYEGNPDGAYDKKAHTKIDMVLFRLQTRFPQYFPPGNDNDRKTHRGKLKAQGKAKPDEEPSAAARKDMGSKCDRSSVPGSAYRHVGLIPVPAPFGYGRIVTREGQVYLM